MQRKDFLKILAATPLLWAGMKLKDLEEVTDNFRTSDKMPVLFIGHGSPMNAIESNAYTDSLKKVAARYPTPTAILVVSAHWLTKGTAVSVNPNPQTIYDFGGFEDALYRVKYEPKGSPDMAREAIKAAAEQEFLVLEDQQMGLDHGAWTVLKHMYPDANIPTFQLSISYYEKLEYHLRLGAALRRLREKGVLIIGSGNVTHNLGRLNWNDINATPFDWAAEFDTRVKENLEKRQFDALVNYHNFGKIAQMAHPSNGHYLPLLYAAGASDKSDELSYLYEGFHFGSLSMRCFQFG